MKQKKNKRTDKRTSHTTTSMYTHIHTPDTLIGTGVPLPICATIQSEQTVECVEKTWLLWKTIVMDDWRIENTLQEVGVSKSSQEKTSQNKYRGFTTQCKPLICLKNRKTGLVSQKHLESLCILDHPPTDRSTCTTMMGRKGKDVEHSALAKLFTWPESDCVCISLAEGKMPQEQAGTDDSCSKGLAVHQQGRNPVVSMGFRLQADCIGFATKCKKLMLDDVSLPNYFMSLQKEKKKKKRGGRGGALPHIKSVDSNSFRSIVKILI